MFSEKEMDAYRQTKAPEELRRKIENCVVPNKKNVLFSRMKVVVAMAACFIFVIILNIFMQKKPIPVTVNGYELEGELMFSPVSSAMSMRAVSVCSVPIELELDEKTFISVSDGFLVVNDKEPVAEMEVAEDVKIWWNIHSSDEITEYEMQIKQGGEITRIILTSNPKDGTITARKSTE